MPERTRTVAILLKSGYEVIEASDGDSALQIIKDTRIDIVVSDWRMPIMDGLTLCKKIKTETPSPPYFIFLTGRDATCDLVAAIDNGSDDFISKPFNNEELRVRIKAGARIVNMQNELKLINKNLRLSLKSSSLKAE
jgi:sigma-B regulation protein RsbU (phosphoserine phosphatase)